MTTTKFARYFFLFCEFLFWHTITYNTQAHRNQHITLHLISFGDRFIFISLLIWLKKKKNITLKKTSTDDDDWSEMHARLDFHDDIDIRSKQ